MADLIYTQQEIELINGFKQKIAEVDKALAVPRAPDDDEDVFAFYIKQQQETKAVYEGEIEFIAQGGLRGEETTPNSGDTISTSRVETETETEYVDPVTGRSYKFAPPGTQANISTTVPLVDEAPDTTKPLQDDEEEGPTGPPLPNELHQYPSYTYGISLHLLSKDQYNDVVKTAKYTPERVLIASAGRYDAVTFPRSEFFNEDFYFEDLEIETIIGMNARSRNTNAIAVSFTVIEPYGFTLIERIMKAAKDIESENYLDMPYLLEIEFFAHNNAGEVVGKLADITKRIPIKIAKMDIIAGVKGAEYAIQAYPFNHSAFDSTTVTTPQHIEVVAGKLSEFFKSNPVVPDQQQDSEREFPNSQFGTTDVIAPVPAILRGNGISNQPKSYADSLSAYYRQLAEKNYQKFGDTYSFVFDPEILKQQKFDIIARGLKSSRKFNKMTDKENTRGIRISNIPGGQASDDFDQGKLSFSIDAGTSIEQVINYAVRMSDYIQEQLVVPEEYAGDPEAYKAELDKIKNKALNWFKITPTVTLGEYDAERNIWQRHITYHIQRYIKKNVGMATAPQQTANKPVKKYEYIYSGKNNDIIDWTLQFNALYYTAVTVYKNSGAILDIGGTSTNRIKEENASAGKLDSNQLPPNAVTPQMTKTQITDTQSTTGSGATTARDVAVADLDASLSVMAGADQLMVNLKIIGDPAYIKQDDIFYSPLSFESVVEADSGSDPRLTRNGSIRTDFSELYVQLLFRTPRDIDESTGLMKFDEGKPVSVFSGMYKVLKVTSSFRQGAFLQNLELVRLPYQSKYDYTDGQKKTTNVERLEVDQSIEPTVDASDITVTPAEGDAEDGRPGVDTTEAEDPRADSDQPALADINATAPTQAITAETAPQAVVTPPDAAKVAELIDEIKSAERDIFEANDINKIGSVPFLRRSATVFDVETAKFREQIIVAREQFPGGTIIEDLQRGIERNERTKAERNAAADQAQIELDRERAELASLQSQLNTLTGQ